MDSRKKAEAVQNKKGVKKFLYITILFIFPFVILAQNVTLSGYIKDKTNGENMVGVTVFVKEIGKATTTNPYGFYSITIPKGKYTVEYRFISYESSVQSVNLEKNTVLNINLSPSEKELSEVEVSTDRPEQNVQSVQMSAVNLDIAEIKKIPAFMGEVDVLKTIQLLPGVKSAGDGNTGFYVRGGGPDQNLILLDEATVYNASHLMGFFSVFNGDAIKNVNLIKGGMPAQYGGRISAVLDIAMKDGNNQKYEVDGGIGVISSRLTLQGPIKKDVSSFIISARRTYADVLAQPYFKYIKKDSPFAGTSYFFYDLNAKINYKFSDKDRVYLSAYFGRDVFRFVDEEAKFNTNIPWGNATACLRWNHVFSSKLFSNASLIYTNYDFAFGAVQDNFELTIRSGIKDWNFKYDVNYYPNPRHNVKLGLNYIFHTFIPTSVSAKQGETVFDLGKIIKLYSHDAAVYIGDDWDITEKLKVNAGLRFSYFAQVGPFTRFTKDFLGKPADTIVYGRGKKVVDYKGLEPRFSMRYALRKSLSVKASYTYNYQYIHLASMSAVSLPTDVWMPCTEVIKPQISSQYAAGVFKNFKDNTYETSIEVYYKDMQNQIDYKEGAQPSDNVMDNPDNGFTFGKGWAYGAEFFVKKRTGKFTGWVGYTLSWTWRQFNEINYGAKYLAKYDRRHDASLVLTYDHSKKWNFGLVWVYGTGNRGTLPNGFFLFEGSLSNDYGLRNSYVFPAYHRMDLNVTFTPDRAKHLERKKARLVNRYTKKGKDPSTIVLPKKWLNNYLGSWTLSIFNVYNRYNPYFIYYSKSGDFAKGNLSVKARQVALFPILPSVTWNFKF
jgi:hypothetical protein